MSTWSALESYYFGVVAEESEITSYVFHLFSTLFYMIGALRPLTYLFCQTTPSCHSNILHPVLGLKLHVLKKVQGLSR